MLDSDFLSLIIDFFACISAGACFVWAGRSIFITDGWDELEQTMTSFVAALGIGILVWRF